MPIKLKENHSPLDGPPKGDDWSGPWGKINPTPRSVEILRVCKGKDSEEIHSYPYRVLSSWHLRRVSQNNQELKIEAGPDTVIISGRGLSRIAKAIGDGCLELIVEEGRLSEIYDETKICVFSIILESDR